MKDLPLASVITASCSVSPVGSRASLSAIVEGSTWLSRLEKGRPIRLAALFSNSASPVALI
jgi:hypothetical protein